MPRVGDPQAGGWLEFHPGGGIVHIAAEDLGGLEQAADDEPIPTRLEHPLGNRHGHHPLVLLFGVSGLVTQPPTGDLAVVQGNRESGNIQKQRRGAVAEEHLAARFVADMLRKPEAVFFFCKHALEAAIAEFEQRKIE